MKLRLGTRGSDLARAQSGRMARALQALGHKVPKAVVVSCQQARQVYPHASALLDSLRGLAAVRRRLTPRTASLLAAACVCGCVCVGWR